MPVKYRLLRNGISRGRSLEFKSREELLATAGVICSLLAAEKSQNCTGAADWVGDIELRAESFMPEKKKRARKVARR